MQCYIVFLLIYWVEYDEISFRFSSLLKSWNLLRCLGVCEMRWFDQERCILNNLNLWKLQLHIKFLYLTLLNLY